MASATLWSEGTEMKVLGDEDDAEAVCRLPSDNRCLAAWSQQAS